MRDFWLGVVTGGALAAIATVWLGFWLYRRRLAEREHAAALLSVAQRAQYETELRWRRQATEWDAFAGQALTAVEDAQHDPLLRLLPRTSSLSRETTAKP